MNMDVNSFFSEFLNRTGKNVKMAGTVCFGMDAKAADRAIRLIIAGEKRAMIYPKNGYRTSMHARPAVGDLNVVVDWNGEPACVIETTAVNEMAVGEISDRQIALAADYADVAAWRDGAIKTEIEELGGSFDDETPIIIEEFRRA